MRTASLESIVISPVVTFRNYTVTAHAHAKLSSRRGFIIVSPAFLDRIGLSKVGPKTARFSSIPRNLTAVAAALTILSDSSVDKIVKDRKRSARNRPSLSFNFFLNYTCCVAFINIAV